MISYAHRFGRALLKGLAVPAYVAPVKHIFYE
jgi:hypothetical protein